MHRSRLLRLLFLVGSAVLLGGAPLRAQTTTTVNYIDGQVDTTSYTGSKVYLNIDSGSAAQTGNVSASHTLYKTGSGTLSLPSQSADILVVQGGTLKVYAVWAPDSVELGTSPSDGGNLNQGGSLAFLHPNYLHTGRFVMWSFSSLTIDRNVETRVVDEFAVNGDNNQINLSRCTLEAGIVSVYGSGNKLNIGIGTGVGINYLFLGQDSSNNQMTVDGRGTWRTFHQSYIGLDAGSGVASTNNSLTVQNGGTMQADGGLILAGSINSNTTNSSGTLNVGAPDLANPTTAGRVTGAGVLFGGGTAAINFNQTDATTFSVSINGPGTVTQRGTGTTTLAGDSGFSGTTVVEAGTLIAGRNTAFGSSSVAVHGGTLDVGGYTLGNTLTLDGGTLAGTGTLTGAVSLGSGATLAPGNSPGTLTFTNGLTLNDGAALNFELGTTSDLLRISGGTLTGSTSAGGITLNLADAGGFTAATYTLFDFSGATTSSFNVSDFTFGSTIAGYTYSLALVGDTLQLTAAVSAVPEPATYATALAAVALLATALRRRRSRSPQPPVSPPRE